MGLCCVRQPTEPLGNTSVIQPCLLYIPVQLQWSCNGSSTLFQSGFELDGDSQ